MTNGEGGLSPTTRRAMLGLALASVAAGARAQTAVIPGIRGMARSPHTGTGVRPATYT